MISENPKTLGDTQQDPISTNKSCYVLRREACDGHLEGDSRTTVYSSASYAVESVLPAGLSGRSVALFCVDMIKEAAFESFRIVGFV